MSPVVDNTIATNHKGSTNYSSVQHTRVPINDHAAVTHRITKMHINELRPNCATEMSNIRRSSNFPSNILYLHIHERRSGYLPLI